MVLKKLAVKVAQRWLGAFAGLVLLRFSPVCTENQILQ
jgi:hypothetical protein